MPDKTINIAYALDDRYTEITCVSMASLLDNTQHPVHFHIIESGLSDESKNILLSLRNRFPHGKMTFLNVSKFNEKVYSTGSTHLTSETYYRLLIPELFPNTEKMIYLDGDTVIDGDIAGLWNVDLGEKTIGAVPNITVSQRGKEKCLDFAENDLYFNAGVLLLNPNRLNRLELREKAEANIERLYVIYNDNNLNWCADQEVLNYLFHSDYLMLPTKYNLLMMFYSDTFRGTSLSDWSEAYQKPVIIHYVGERKPDKITREVMPHPMWERYYTYKAMTPYADAECDKKAIDKYKFLESNMGKALIVDTTKYIQYKRHTLFSELVTKLPDMLKNKKLALWGAGIDIEYVASMIGTEKIYADVIVDGLPRNQGKKIFHYTVLNPDILQGTSGEYFVLLCMRSEKAAVAVVSVLTAYGYSNTDFYHVYKPLWNCINGFNADWRR